MLKYRILTAIVLIPVILLAIFWPNVAVFAVLMALIVIIGAYEWARLSNIRQLAAVIYSLSTLLPIILLYYFQQPWLYLGLIAIAVLFWLVATFIVIAWQKHRQIFPESRTIFLLLGQLVLLPTWCSLFYIRDLPEGKFLLLFLMLVIWGADTGAYFIGRRWGRHSLASCISPSKTWEGVAAGLVAGIGVGVIYLIVGNADPALSFVIIGISLLTVMFSITGDLFESIAKRKANVKDSSQLLPGHGGVLDRIDSLTAAGPFFALALTITGITT